MRWRCPLRAGGYHEVSQKIASPYQTLKQAVPKVQLASPKLQISINMKYKEIQPVEGIQNEASASYPDRSVFATPDEFKTMYNSAKLNK